MTSPHFTVSIEQVKRYHAAYDGSGRSAWRELVLATPGGVDLSQVEHRCAVHTVLNRWGCRLKNADGRNESAAAQALQIWWSSHSGEMKSLLSTDITDLNDLEIETAADLYWRLRLQKAGPRRRVGPVTAAKVFLAMGPRTFPAWDTRIARVLYGGIGRDMYRDHLVQSKTWASDLTTHHGPELKLLMNDEGRIQTAKLIDECLYGLLTRPALKT